MSDFLRAAKYTDKRHPAPHQIAAWTWAWEQLTAEQQAEFLAMFRAAVPDKLADVPNSWAGIAEAAKQAGAKFPELVAAQWALESGWGKHFTGTFNPFGQKGPGTKIETEEVINGERVQMVAEFLDFRSLREATTYLVDRWHRDFTANGHTYRGVNHAPNRNAAAAMLVAEGYATDPQYAEKLIRLMDGNAPQEDEPPGKPAVGPESPFGELLTPHIRLGEFALDQEARRFVHQHQVDTALELAVFLEKVRRAFGGRPVIITSGYRPPAINAAVGGASASEHLYSKPGEGAVDFLVEGANVKEVEKWCDRNWPHSVGYGAHLGFVHVGRRAAGGRRRWAY